MSDAKIGIDSKFVQTITNIVKKSNLAEIEIQKDNFKLRIVNSVDSKYQIIPTQQTYCVPEYPAPEEKSFSAQKNTTLKEDIIKNQILSPMVGTAYAAPSPDSKPFVELGQWVEEGKTLVIIEAMKTMNHIPAPRSGKITAIFFKNGQPIEFGEPLLSIE